MWIGDPQRSNTENLMLQKLSELCGTFPTEKAKTLERQHCIEDSLLVSSDYLPLVSQSLRRIRRKGGCRFSHTVSRLARPV